MKHTVKLLQKIGQFRRNEISYASLRGAANSASDLQNAVAIYDKLKKDLEAAKITLE